MLRFITSSNLLIAANAAFSSSCYIESTNLAGTKKGTKYTDHDTLQAQISSLSEVHRSAAIKSCQQSSNNELVGIQVALTRYSANMYDIPVDEELMWLPGIGIVEGSSAVTCETTVIERTAGLEKWLIISDESGITSH
jgi:hypothetical protein